MTIELIESEASGYIEPECLDLREIIARVAEVARGRSRYDTKVQCILPHDPVWIDDHPEAALRLCLNLALNAVDATPGGEVTLSVSGHTDATAEVDLIAGKLPQPPFVMLDVADDGPGIPDELRARIWERGVSTKGPHGSGEGLAIVRRLVEEAGAGIALCSDVDGRTTFRVYWPASVASALDTSTTSSCQSMAQSTGSGS
jgi:signal transduction histidine kinase